MIWRWFDFLSFLRIFFPLLWPRAYANRGQNFNKNLGHLVHLLFFCCKLCDKTEISIITCRYVNCNERGAQSRGIPYVKYALFSCSKYWSFDQQPWTRMATKELQNWGKTSKMTWFDEQTICLSFVLVSIATRLDFVLYFKLSKSAKMSRFW